MQAGGDRYDLGIAGSYGLDGVSVVALDENGDGKRELVVTGGMGAAYEERKIFGYDPVKKRWLKLLTMGTPWDDDLAHPAGRPLMADACCWRNLNEQPVRQPDGSFEQKEILSTPSSPQI
ncbi:MAG TPA: hypothetical protein GX507_00705 [Clostridia bacterium]|nr:hypothetical protein [Clostridia bacterium]